jgi:hypothetical protein
LSTAKKRPLFLRRTYTAHRIEAKKEVVYTRWEISLFYRFDSAIRIIIIMFCDPAEKINRRKASHHGHGGEESHGATAGKGRRSEFRGAA